MRLLLSTMSVAVNSSNVTDSSTTVTVSNASNGDSGAPDSGGQADTFSVVQVDPPSGSVLAQSPSTVTVTFNLQVDQYSLDYDDFALDQVNPDGSLTPLDPTGALGLVTEVGLPASGQNSVTFAINQPLPPGQYDVMLLGSSTIAGLNASGSDVFWTPPGGCGTDTPVGEFTVATPGVTVAQATNLGVIGATPVTITGALDLAANPSAVSLYQVTLAPGNTWLFGAEIWASRIDSPLKATLSLFSDVNGQGELVGTSSVGGPDAPSDPYLFAGLQPGVYYVGVSGVGNVPGTSGGYNPFTGTAGVGTAAVGGTFELDLAAVPHNGPAQVESFALNDADPLGPSPTGFSLSFSGAMNLAGVNAGSFTGLEAVDQSGTVWGVTPVSVNAAANQLTFVFDAPLPPGRYTLQLPSAGGLTDLAGLAPVAPGEPAGVLASWTVAPSTVRRSPTDLGAVYPDSSGATFNTTLAPGASVSYRVVALTFGAYSLDNTSTGGPLAIQVAGPTGSLLYNRGSSGGSNSSLLILEPGVYNITLKAVGNQPVQVQGALRLASLTWEHMLVNATGQNPAINLLFVTSAEPAATSPTVGSTAPGGPSTTWVVPADAAGDTGGSGSVLATAVTSSTPASPGGLVLTLGGSLAGTLGPMAAQTTAGVPVATFDLSSQALVTAPPTQPIPARVGNPTSSSGPEEVSTDDSDPGIVLVATDGALTAELTPADAVRDARVIAESEWFARLGARLRRWYLLAPPPTAAADTDAVPVDAGTASPERIALQHGDVLPAEVDQVDRADFTIPLGIGALSLAAVRLRQPIRRWWRGRARPLHAPGPVHHGPHRKI